MRIFQQVKPTNLKGVIHTFKLHSVSHRRCNESHSQVTICEFHGMGICILYYCPNNATDDLADDSSTIYYIFSIILSAISVRVVDLILIIFFTILTIKIFAKVFEKYAKQTQIRQTLNNTIPSKMHI